MKKFFTFFKGQQFLVLLVGLLVISNGVTAYFLVNQGVTKNNNGSSINVIQDDSKGNDTALGPRIDISVDWLAQPKIVNTRSFFGDDFLKADYSKQALEFRYNSLVDRISYVDWLKTIQIYQVGKINTTGKYFGQDLFVVNYVPGYAPDSPSPYPDIVRIIKNGSELVYLTNAENWAPEELTTKKFVNANITNLQIDSTITIPKTNLTLVRLPNGPTRLFSDYTNVQEKFKFNNQAVYQDLSTNCFLVKANDGTASNYYFNLPFSGKEGESSQYLGIVPSIFDFNWLDGSKNSNEYLSDRYASGSYHGCFGYADYITDISLLNKVGQNNSGDIFYELKQDMKEKIGDREQFVLQSMYKQYYPGYDEATKKQTVKMTFEDFIKTHPIIFWPDPFGRFIEFKNAKYLPAAEMGKPVIYLYPEKVIDVTVEVKPTGGFSKTEPAYNNGWKVSAKPSGVLYNYADSKVYPYLFWEGFGLNYTRPKEGFVVKKDDIKNFLENKLAQAGLIKHEFDEFIAFWLPKMQSDPYYFVTFVPEEQFSQMAPLKILPQPNTIIRVFMDYQGLTAPIKVNPQVITTPIRKGFTVVEWGGQLRH